MLIIVPIFVILIIILIILIFFNIMDSRKLKSKTNSVEQELQNLQKEIICVNGSSIPNKNIKQIFGTIKGISKMAYSENEFNFSEKQAMNNLLQEAKKIGANAIINLQLDTATHGVNANGSQVIYLGTAIKV